jgi:hypothetical protein
VLREKIKTSGRRREIGIEKKQIPSNNEQMSILAIVLVCFLYLSLLL